MCFELGLMLEEAATEKILELSANPVNALASNSAVLAEQLTCHICSNLCLDPYMLACGHSFCGACLSTWIKEKKNKSTCPMCRVRVKTPPVYNKSLRVILDCIIASYNASLPAEKAVLFESKQKSYDEQFTASLPSPKEPIFSEEDNMYMCADCMHEVYSSGWCSNCEAYYPQVASGSGSDDLINDDDNDDDDDDMASFIDDGSIMNSDSDLSFANFNRMETERGVSGMSEDSGVSFTSGNGENDGTANNNNDNSDNNSDYGGYESDDTDSLLEYLATGREARPRANMFDYYGTRVMMPIPDDDVEELDLWDSDRPEIDEEEDVQANDSRRSRPIVIDDSDSE